MSLKDNEVRYERMKLMKFWFETSSKKFTSIVVSSFLSYMVTSHLLTMTIQNKSHLRRKTKKVFLSKSLPVNIAANKS